MDAPAPAPAAATVAIRLRHSTEHHDAYTVRVADRRVAVLATARPSDARRWVCTTRWLHPHLLHRSRLVVGLGVQWTATLGGATPPVPATLQLCVGHRCLVFHLARLANDATVVPEMLRRFLADPRVTFVGHGSANDCRMLSVHYGIHVARGRELRAMAAGIMGKSAASMEAMADRILGYPGITKSRDVAMSDWHGTRRLSVDQVLYAALDAFLAFRLGAHLCPLQPDFGGSPVRVDERSPPPPAPPVASPPSDSVIDAAANGSSSCSSNKVVVDTGAAAAGLSLPGSDDSDVGNAAAAAADDATHAGSSPVVRADDASDPEDDDSSDGGFQHVTVGASTDSDDDSEDDFYVLL